MGGVYATCPTSPNGKSVEYFLVDPTTPLDVKALGVTPRGVKLVKFDGVYHVLDWVGSQHYTNVADFVEEVRRHGASRRLPRTLDFSKLTRASRLVLIHARAHIANSLDYYERMILQGWTGRYPPGEDLVTCPKGLTRHCEWELEKDGTRMLPEECCAALWWQDVEGLTEHSEEELGWHAIRSGTRTMPWGTYEARRRPNDVVPRYLPAVFMRLPITNLTVIRSRDGAHEEALHAAEQSDIDVTLEDE